MRVHHEAAIAADREQPGVRGYSIVAVIAEGNPAPMVASVIIEQQRVRHIGS